MKYSDLDNEKCLFVCSVTLLLITILILTESLALKAVVFFLLLETLNPYLEVTVFILCIEICSASSESAAITVISKENKTILT